MIEVGKAFCAFNEKDCPVIFSEVTVIGADPWFASKTEAPADVPTVTLPRFTELAEGTRLAAPDPFSVIALQPLSAIVTAHERNKRGNGLRGLK